MKNDIRRITACICSAAIIASMAAMTVSASEASEASSETDGAVIAVEATSDNVKLLGRTLYFEDSLWLGNTASGVEFTTSSTFVTFKVKNSGDPTKTSVLVDGKVDFYDNVSGTTDIKVELDGSEHTVRFLKLSEAAQSEIAIQSIETDSPVAPTEAKAHTIEFIGDSITCGYGDELALNTQGFSTKSENGALTYAYQTGLMLDADVSVFAQSGNGIYCTYGGGRSNLIKEYYEKCSTFCWNSISDSEYTLMKDFDWDFSITPDLVVINLGTNDWSYFKSHKDEVNLYEEDYVKFIGQVRAANPDAHIMCVLGLMGDELYENLENAVNTYSESTGDKNVSAFHLTPIDSEADGYAIDYHPTVASHTKAAKELSANIAEVMGWATVEPADEGYTGYYVYEAPAVESQAESESSSESTSESTSESSSESSSAAESSSTSSTASSAKSSDKSTGNPSTGNTAAGLALIAAMGGAVIAVKRKK